MYGKTWETSPGTNVGEPTIPNWNSRDGENALSKVKFNDFDWIGDRRKGNFLIPLEKKNHIRADLFTQARTASDAIVLQMPSNLIVR